MQVTADVFASDVLKHCSTRWCTIIKAIVRILEQWKHSCEYFLKFLPEQNIFKKEIKGTLRYKQISECSKSKYTVPYLSFVVFIGMDFEKFLIFIQMLYLLICYTAKV